MKKIKRRAKPSRYPSLSMEQIQKPVLAINEFFREIHLDEARDILWEWFAFSLRNAETETLQKREVSDIVYMFESVRKLLEANYLIYQGAKHNIPPDEN